MKTNDNGIIRDLTAEEIIEMQEAAARIPEPEVSPEERIKQLEEALALLLSGAVE